MSTTFTLTTRVAYGDVDRDGAILLPAVFRLLQEAAIAHADEFDLGTRALDLRGESWVLHRIAVAIHRYPRHPETLRIETWSGGIEKFKGRRETRILSASGDVLVAATSLWLYVNVRSKAIARVPTDVAARLPRNDAAAYSPDLESQILPPPPPDAGSTLPVTLRYSDLDVNAHVNHTAYVDCLQTALAHAGHSPRPQALRIRFIKEIPTDARGIVVRLGPREDRIAFSIEGGDSLYAQGDVL